MLSQPFRDGLERGMSHICAGAVAEDQQMVRVTGPK
jgi:hypothetical protein